MTPAQTAYDRIRREITALQANRNQYELNEMGRTLVKANQLGARNHKGGSSGTSVKRPRR
jgi:hypothetical protein